MTVNYLGHSCFLIETAGSKLLFDPFISSNPFAQGIKIDEIQADYILVSHGHIDHIEDLERIYKNQEKVTLISSFEITSWYKKNRDIARAHPMGPGGKWKFDFGTVNVIAECHSSSLPNGTYAGVPLGFIIETENITFYFAGDTALHQNMKQIPIFHKIDFAMFPIGGNFTMDIDQAVIAADYVKTNKIIGMHYDTDITIKINHKKVMETAQQNNKDLILMDIGSNMKF